MAVLNKGHEITKKVVDEMNEFIPGHSYEQNILRSCYYSSRMHNFSKKVKNKTSAWDTFQNCLEECRKQFPSFVFKFDEKLKEIA